MTEKDFNAYMSGERVPANTWDSALMICEVLSNTIYTKNYLDFLNYELINLIIVEPALNV